MKHSSVKRVLLSFVASAGVLCSNAQTNSINIVTTAVPFLRISPDARAGGMGDVGIATTPDANSAFWNLAKTPFTKNKSAVSLTYTPWLKDLGLNDVYLLCASGYYKLDDINALSLSTRYFSLGTIQFTDANGNDLQKSNPKEYSAELGYSRKLGEKLGLGVTLKYINSSLISGSAGSDATIYKAGTSIAGDISLFKNAPGENGEGLSWGVALSNLGTKIGYTNDAQNKDYIPANLGLGLAYTIVPDEGNRFSFALDVNKLLVPGLNSDSTIDAATLAAYRSKSVVNSWFSSFSDGGNQLQKLQASVGAEYTYADQFSLRTGYFYESNSQGGRKYLTFGAGLKYNVITINISYLASSGNGVTRNPLSNTLRFGVTFDLDGGSAGADASSLSGN
ncbi:type IX secretion system outer membrane channel protein PorV [Parasediminibacterium sp. JCM 36343]|uniref:type IX secretion system outer membrane channel protein PorV n=1 Tax=Parasediminibacterium sp. JCM 36343 TaxID=3374279 RepID=UPI003977FD29